MKNYLLRLRDRCANIKIDSNRRICRWGSRWGIGIAIAVTNIFLNPSPAPSAEQIRFWYPPFGEFTVYVSDLEKFVKEGVLTKRLGFYLERISEQDQQQLREALATRYDVNRVSVAQFAYSPIGEILLKRMGRIIQMTPDMNGFSAIRSSLILSAQSEQGLSVIDLLQKYPVPVVYMDLPQALKAYEDISQLIYKKEQVLTAITKQAAQEASSSQIDKRVPDPNQQDLSQDLRLAGNVLWTKEKFTYWQGDRKVNVAADIYLPEGLTKPAPLIVISHGLGSNPDTLQYLSQHLASYGFAVAALEHPKTGSRDFQAFLSGLSKAPQPEEAVQRPRDVVYLLDALEQKANSDSRWRDRLNTQQVGLIGHSLGGYTVLTLGGAPLNFPLINQECSIPEPNIASFNISKVLQCRFSSLSPDQTVLSDRRVKAIIAINPLGGSTLLGKQGMQNIQIPIAIFASGDDIFTPAVPEQIFPFTWLTSPHKYLVTFSQGTHFSFLERSDRGTLVIPESLLGEKPEFTHPYAKAFSLAFFETYLRQRSEFASYLTNRYMQAIANPKFPVSLINNYSEAQLQNSLDD